MDCIQKTYINPICNLPCSDFFCCHVEQTRRAIILRCAQIIRSTTEENTFALITKSNFGREGLANKICLPFSFSQTDVNVGDFPSWHVAISRIILLQDAWAGSDCEASHRALETNAWKVKFSNHRIDHIPHKANLSLRSMSFPERFMDLKKTDYNIY